MLQLSSISKRYGDHLVLENISFTVNPGDRLGLIGPNGCGKSTLLRIIAGREPPDSGSVQFIPPDLRLGYLEQGLSYRPNETVGEALQASRGELVVAEQRVAELASRLAAAEGAEQSRLAQAYSQALAELEALTLDQTAPHDAETALAGLGLGEIPLETPVAILSGGQKTRLGLARLLLKRPQLLLLDEPTNHLDIPSRSRFEQAIAAFAGTVPAVVHDRYFIRSFASRLWAVAEGSVRSYVDLEDWRRGRR